MVPLTSEKGCSTCDLGLYEKCLFYKVVGGCVNDRTSARELEEVDNGSFIEDAGGLIISTEEDNL